MSPVDLVKICPRCGLAAELPAPVCTACGRRFQTSFTFSPATQTLLVPPRAMPAARTLSRTEATVILPPRHTWKKAMRRVVTEMRAAWHRAKPLFGRTHAPQSQHKPSGLKSRLHKA